MKWGSPLPRSPTLTGVFYDDLVVATIVKTKEVLQIQGPDYDVIHTALSAYADANLPVSTPKSVGFARGASSSADTTFTAWGTEVCSPAGSAGAPALKRALLMLVGLRVAFGGWASGGFLRKLVGCFVHPFSHRKELSSVWNRLYKYRETMSEDKIEKLPADIRDDNLMASLCLPVAFSHLRWPIDTEVTCSDATPDSEAVVSCRVSAKLCESLYDTSVMRGCHVPFGASCRELAEAESEMPVDPLIEEVCDSMKWNLQTAKTFKNSLHVNLRELNGLCAVTKQASGLSLFPVRRVNGTDSLVSAGAFAKGRSPSYRLNQILRRNLGSLVAGQKSQAIFKIDTKHNQADDPTRMKEIRDPVPPPSWLRDHLIPDSTSTFRRGRFWRWRGGACR